MSTKIQLKQIENFKFECSNSTGKTAIIDGPAKIGGSDDGVRPMEMILMGLAGCSSFDLLSILKKQRQEVNNITIDVEAERADEIPAVFTKIHLLFNIEGQVNQKKLDKALELSVDKYCSVAKMLKPSVEISWEGRILG